MMLLELLDFRRRGPRLLGHAAIRLVCGAEPERLQRFRVSQCAEGIDDGAPGMVTRIIEEADQVPGHVAPFLPTARERGDGRNAYVAVDSVQRIGFDDPERAFIA